MRCGRIFLASIAILAVMPSLVGAPAPVRAGGFQGAALTDFTQVTPATAIYYSVAQNTNDNQNTNLRALGGDLSAHVDVQSLLKQALGSSASDLPGAELVINQVLASLQKIFNGEFGVAVLPISISATSRAVPDVTVHLLLDAGLQSGISADQLGAELSLLGPSIVKQAPHYRNLPVAELDLRSLIKNAARSATGHDRLGGPGMAAPIISGDFFGAVAGNDAVLASDLPTLKQALDTYFGMAPSIAGVYDFRQTVGALPTGPPPDELRAYRH